jgi:hypothetical protein
MATINDLAEYIDEHCDRILERLDTESVDVYVFLCDRFAASDVMEDRIFQFVFRSYYRLDSAGLTSEFKITYFKKLQALRTFKVIDLRCLLMEFFPIPTLQGNRSLHFSFVSKLAHTINPSYPIYDSQVRKVFGFALPNYGRVESRIDKLLTFYSRLQSTYARITAGGLMRQTICSFETRFPAHCAKLSSTKVLDFIFWSTGKLIEDGKLEAPPVLW